MVHSYCFERFRYTFLQAKELFVLCFELAYLIVQPGIPKQSRADAEARDLLVQACAENRNPRERQAGGVAKRVLCRFGQEPKQASERHSYTTWLGLRER